MSEFQHYAFVALDRPLTDDEMAALRALSTRATITPRSFTNEYHWGDFKGDPDQLMARYFDAHTYVANWGTRRFMLRFPTRAVDLAAWAPYLVEDRVWTQPAVEFTVLVFHADYEGGVEEVYDEGDYDAEGGSNDILVNEADEWLPAFEPLREAVLEADYRTLYLGWLAAVQDGFVDDAAAEPPVPPGLGHLSPALRRWCEFLQLEPALVRAASRLSEDVAPAFTREAIAAWIADLPPSQKDALLVRLVADRAPVGAELRRRIAADAPRPAARPTRTVAQLLAEADEIRAAFERQAAEEARQAKLRAAEAYARKLDALEAREEAAWEAVEAVFDAPLKSYAKGQAYEEKALLLRDLGEVAIRGDREQAFQERVDRLRVRHAKRTAFWTRYDRLTAAGSVPPAGH